MSKSRFALASHLIKTLTTFAALSIFVTLAARAEVAISLGEQKARLKEDSAKGKSLRLLFWQGTGGPGHATLFVSDLCTDGSYFKLRMCEETESEKGVYLSFIGGLSMNHSWIAVPANIYLYGVEKLEDQPLYSTTFNSAFFEQKDPQRKASEVSQSFVHGRISSLDLARENFLGASSVNSLGGSPHASDKVNLYVTSERDIYNIIIHGDTKVEAQRLLDHFNSVTNLTKAPVGTHEKVEGSFSYWRNCTARVNEWMTIMFGKEVSVTPSVAEVKIENPRHYARLFLEKTEQLRKNNKWDRDISIEYVPKVTSDRSASVGFGSPAHNLYDPRTIGGVMMWVHQTPAAGVFLLANERNIRFKIKNSFDKTPSLDIEQARLAVAHSQGEAKAQNTARLLALTDAWFGTSADWQQADKQLQSFFEAARANSSLPVELRALIKDSAAKRGKFAAAVAAIMAHRSQASREGDIQYLQLHFKGGSEPRPGEFVLTEQDEATEYKTGVTASTITQGHNALSLMLMLAVVDNYLAEKPENRPSWPEMKTYLQLLQQTL